jgi:hypothetical protein
MIRKPFLTLKLGKSSVVPNAIAYSYLERKKKREGGREGGREERIRTKSRKKSASRIILSHRSKFSYSTFIIFTIFSYIHILTAPRRYN